MSLLVIPVGMLETNCYVLAGKEKNCFVIDPGAQPEKIIGEIDARGLTPKYLLLTHGHHDHTGGVKRLQEKYPGMKVYIGEKDAEMLTDENIRRMLFNGKTPEQYRFERVGTMKEGDTFTLDELTLHVYETPGHTKGGLTFVCGELMFTGDTLFFEEVGRCDLYGGSFETLKKSLKKLCALPGDYKVYPGHGESSTLDHERRHNPYIIG